MIIYNVTVKIDNDVHDEWIQWMRENHIPDVMNTGCFVKYEMSKVLVDDADGITYSIQYRSESMDELTTYFDSYAKKLQEEHTTKYKDKFVAFRTLLELI